MDNAGVVGGIILAGLVVVAIVIKVILYFKNSSEKFNLNSFIETYGPRIVELAKDVVKMLEIQESSFESREEYEKTIIAAVIDNLKDNYNELDIDTTILNIVDTTRLADIIYSIIHANAIDIFSVLKSDTVENHAELYDEEVVVSVSIINKIKEI